MQNSANLEETNIPKKINPYINEHLPNRQQVEISHKVTY